MTRAVIFDLYGTLLQMARNSQPSTAIVPSPSTTIPAPANAKLPLNWELLAVIEPPSRTYTPPPISPRLSLTRESSLHS